MYQTHVGVLLLLLHACAVAGPEENATARINGITQFMVDRAHETYFYIFEKKMRENRAFACYFPETHAYIGDGDLKALIKTSDIWQETMDRDFAVLEARVIAHGFHAALDLNRVAMTATDEYAELLRYLKLSIAGRDYALSFIPLDASQTARDAINGFYTDFIRLRDRLLAFDDTLQEYENICSPGRPTGDELRADIEQLKQAYGDLDHWLQHIQGHKNLIRIDLAAIELDCQQNPQAKICMERDRSFDAQVAAIRQSLEKPLAKAVTQLTLLDTYLENIRKRQSYTSKVVEAFKLIREEQLEGHEDLARLKHYALFIGQVADSASSQQVDGLLREYTLPVTSFLAKREAGESVLMVTSYLGYATGKVMNDDRIDSDNAGGFYAPIGFEYSRGLGQGSSLSIMLSPVDFAYPVSLKLNGLEQDIELDEIAAPSISFAYGIKNYPLNIGIAFQKGKRFEAQNQEEKRLLLFMAFDMPLFAF